MDYDGFLELVMKRRSIRKFKPDPIPDEHIEKIIEAARWAMSGANAQPWEFIVVKDKERKDKIVDLYVEHVKADWHIEKTRVQELRHPAFIDGMPKNPPGFKDAPVFIVICGDPRTLQASVLSINFWPDEGTPWAIFSKNMGNATQILHLAATAIGLGTQWVSISRPLEAPLKALLGIPAELIIPTIVPVGYPAYEPPPPYRRELKEIMHLERYDLSKFRSGENIVEFVRALRQRTKPGYRPGWE